MDDALRKLAQSVQVIRSLHRGARGGEVEGYATKGAVTEDSAPKHFHEERRKAWNSIPNHAEDVRQRLEQELNIPATISKSDTAFGRSWYVRPHIQSNDENPFVIRLSDHSANQRLHQVETRVNLMHSGPGVRAGSEQMRSNEDIEQQKNNAINFAKEYAERNRFGGGGYVRTAYKKGGDVEAYGDGGGTHEPHKRAEEQGYSIKGYHFTRGQRAENIAKTGKFDPTRSFSPNEEAIFFWTHPDAANEWANFQGFEHYPTTPMGEDILNRKNPVIMPVRVNPGKHIDIDWLEHSKHLQQPAFYNSQLMGNLINHAKKKGYDTMRIRNMSEGMSQPHDQLAVLNPTNIRSEFAQFNPERQHENDIGAHTGGYIKGYATKGAVTDPLELAKSVKPAKRVKKAWDSWKPTNYQSWDDVPTINPQDLVGKKVGSLLADLTRASGHFSGIDSSQLSAPEPMYGGPGYPLMPLSQKNKLGWAVQGKGRGTAKLNKGSDYIAVHAMNQNSHLSNTSLVNSIIGNLQAYVRDKRITPEAVQELNSLIKKPSENTDLKELQNFPGFNDPNIGSYLHSIGFPARLQIAKHLGSASAEKLGAPSVEKIQRDTLDKDFAGTPYGHAGFLLEMPKGSADSLVRLGQKGLPSHTSYDWGMHGRIVGKFAHPVAPEILHQPFFDRINEENKTKKTAKGKPPNARRAFELSLPSTLITQEIADKLPRRPIDIQSGKAAQLALNAFNDQWSDTDTSKKEGGVGTADFSRALRNSDSSSTLSQYSEKELNDMKKAGKFTGYKLKDGEVYFGLKHGTDYGDEYGFHHPDLTNNETALTSVVNNEPGAKGIGGAPVVLKALQHGATALDAYAVPTDKHPNGFLPDFYSHFGFDELGRVPFDPKYVTPQQYSDMKHEWAKTGWDEQRHGLPSLAIMKWRGSDADRQDAVRRFVQKSGESYRAGASGSDVGRTNRPVQQGAGQSFGASSGQLGNGDASGDRGAVGTNNAPRPSDRFTRTLAAVKTLQPHEAQNFGLNPADIERAKASGLSTGGSVRRAYMKGGKVEGSVWHERDAFGFGGDTESAGSAPERGGSGTVAAEHEEAPEQHEQRQSDPEGREHPSSEAEKLANQGTFPSWAGVNSGGNEAAVNKSAADVAASRLAQAEHMSVLNNGVTNAQATAAETPPSAASAANAAMSAAFSPVGATTSFGQQPPQAGLFTPEHFESTLEQNLVEPAFSQPMTQPAFPHTPPPTADTATHLGGTPATGVIPDTATHLGGTPATGALGVTQPSFPHTPTPDTAYNTASFQPDANAAARQARNSITQNMGADPTSAPIAVASTPVVRAPTSNIPTPPTRPAELGPSAVSGNIFDQINAANLQRISDLEAQKNKNNPGYFNSTSGLSKQEWADQMGADPTTVQTRLVDMGNGMQPDYYTKGLDQVFGEMVGGIAGAPSAIMSGIGNAFSPSQNYDPLTGKSRPDISPFVGGGQETGGKDFLNSGKDQVATAKPKTHMVQKLMPDGTYQWVEEPFKKGGKVYRPLVGSQMTDHVISKFGVPLSASKYQPNGNKAGRR